jgi:hypothetical protein
LGCPIIILPVYGSPDSRTLPGEGIINEVLEVHLTNLASLALNVSLVKRNEGQQRLVSSTTNVELPTDQRDLNHCNFSVHEGVMLGST